jgi:hypothetical protein
MQLEWRKKLPSKKKKRGGEGKLAAGVEKKIAKQKINKKIDSYALDL